MSESRPSYAIRPASLDDLHAVVALVNDCSIAEGGQPDQTPQNLLSDWNTPGFTLATDAWIATAPDGKVIGYEQVEVGDADAPYELDGYVHPDFTGQGIWEHAPIAFDDWSRRQIGRDDFDPAFWFLATAGDQVVGTALCYARSAEMGWVRHLGVRRGWRARGLGLALLQQAFGAF